MTDVVFIHPSAAHDTYGPLATAITAVEPPAWLRMCAAYARSRGYSVAAVDQEAENLSPLEVAERVRRIGPRLVVVCVYGHQPSASTQTVPAACEVSRVIKDFMPELPILWVGGHVSALPERTLREEPCDFACVGEGPETIVALLRTICAIPPDKLKSTETPGLVYWEDERSPPEERTCDRGQVICNPRAPDLPMSELRGDAWDLLPMDRYRAHTWQCLDGSPRAPYASIVTSLNCPYKCDFCCISAPFAGHQYRTRDFAEVVDEIVQLYHLYGVRTFKIVDELFLLNRYHVRAVAEGLIATGFAHELNIWCYGRTDTVDERDLALLSTAGFRWIALGIEAASSVVRGVAKKALKNDKWGTDIGNDEIKRTVATIRRAGISIVGNYIFGLEDDTHDTMRATLDLALELNTEWANFYCAMPYPGSPLYDRILRERPEDLPSTFERYSQHNRHTYPLRNANLSSREILAFRDAAHVEYFIAPSYQRMLRNKFGHDALLAVDQMLKHKLERDLLK